MKLDSIQGKQLWRISSYFNKPKEHVQSEEHHCRTRVRNNDVNKSTRLIPFYHWFFSVSTPYLSIHFWTFLVFWYSEVFRGIQRKGSNMKSCIRGMQTTYLTSTLTFIQWSSLELIFWFSEVFRVCRKGPVAWLWCEPLLFVAGLRFFKIYRKVDQNL